jgi:hypothetical protein
MATNTLDYRIRGHPDIGTIQIPRETPSETNTLLSTAITAELLKDPTHLSANRFSQTDGLMNVLTNYAERRVPVILAEPMVTLSVAKQIATRNPVYSGLLPEIEKAQRAYGIHFRHVFS